MKNILYYYVNYTKKRFFKYVNKTDNCWEWIGSLDTRGYGQFFICGKLINSHRVSFIINKGKIRENLHVLHSCDNKKCVKPDHLRLGTDEENRLEKIFKRRHSFGEKSGRAKLTTEQVIEIRNTKLCGKKKDKLTIQMLAEKYNVGKRTICSVRWNETWKHI